MLSTMIKMITIQSHQVVNRCENQAQTSIQDVNHLLQLFQLQSIHVIKTVIENYKPWMGYSLKATQGSFRLISKFWCWKCWDSWFFFSLEISTPIWYRNNINFSKKFYWTLKKCWIDVESIEKIDFTSQYAMCVGEL